MQLSPKQQVAGSSPARGTKTAGQQPSRHRPLALWFWAVIPQSVAPTGALLSSDDYGSSVEPTAKLHPLWQALCRGRAASVRLPGEAAVSVPLGAQGSDSAGARCLPRLLLALSRFRRMSLFAYRAERLLCVGVESCPGRVVPNSTSWLRDGSASLGWARARTRNARRLG